VGQLSMLAGKARHMHSNLLPSSLPPFTDHIHITKPTHPSLTHEAYHYLPSRNRSRTATLNTTHTNATVSHTLHLEPNPPQAAAIMNRLFGAKNNAPKPTLNSAISNVRPHEPLPKKTTNPV
jgi:hypothetical protein